MKGTTQPSRPRLRPVILSLVASIVFIFSLSASEAPRQWVNQEGRSIMGTLVAADEKRCTLELTDGRNATFPIADLNEDSQNLVREWVAAQEKNGVPVRRPIKPWPTKASAGENSRFTSHEDKTGIGAHIYRSRHFELQSDVPLLSGTVKEFTDIFEATMAAVKALPMDIDPKPPGDYHGVSLILDETNYLNSGGYPGTAGIYNAGTKRLVISLSNMGFSMDDQRLRLDYRRSLIVLKHEAAHQVTGAWMLRLPIWLAEGWAEYIASVPYENGTYHFTNMTEATTNYLNKWRRDEDQRRIPIIHPEVLMGTDNSGWFRRIKEQNAVLNYNSAGLLVHYFLHFDGNGDGSQMLAFFDAVRNARNYIEMRSIIPNAMDEYLLRGRSYGELAADFAASWKKHGITLLFDESR